MTYYDNGLDTAEAEASFDDPTAELEASGEADADLGDGAADPRKRRTLDIDPDQFRKSHMKRGL